MQLPQELPEFEEPLAAPDWMQWPMMATVPLAPSTGFFWLYTQYQADGLEVSQYVSLVIL